VNSYKRPHDFFSKDSANSFVADSSSNNQYDSGSRLVVFQLVFQGLPLLSWQDPLKGTKTRIAVIVISVVAF